jgi:streptomycin 6-kinase
MKVFDDWIDRWALVIDGSPIHTASGDLLPVVREGTPAMLKIARTDEERRGASLMIWYAGDGAVRVLDSEGRALLLERPPSGRSLVDMSARGLDDEATRILCATAGRLHAPRPGQIPPGLVPLDNWFRALTSSLNPSLERAAAVARALLADPQDVTVLHGDIHHGNVLDGARRGWLAIDPKGLHGERAFDYANIFCNPDRATASAPSRLARRIDIVSEAAHLDRGRLLQWVVAYAGLSAAWCLEDGENAALPFAVMRLASEQLPSS